MSNRELLTGYKQIILQCLRESLPELFRIHHKLINVAAPKTKVVNCSLNELGEMFNYEPSQLYDHLLNLLDLRFIDCPRVFDFDKKVTIKILVSY